MLTKHPFVNLNALIPIGTSKSIIIFYVGTSSPQYFKLVTVGASRPTMVQAIYVGASRLRPQCFQQVTVGAPRPMFSNTPTSVFDSF